MSGGAPPSRFKNIAVFCGVRCFSPLRAPAPDRACLSPALLSQPRTTTEEESAPKQALPPPRMNQTPQIHRPGAPQAADGARPVYAEAAEALGRELVRRGIGLVYGGGSVGLMGKARERGCRCAVGSSRRPCRRPGLLLHGGGVRAQRREWGRTSRVNKRTAGLRRRPPCAGVAGDPQRRGEGARGDPRRYPSPATRHPHTALPPRPLLTPPTPHTPPHTPPCVSAPRVRQTSPPWRFPARPSVR